MTARRQYISQNKLALAVSKDLSLISREKNRGNSVTLVFLAVRSSITYDEKTLLASLNSLTITIV